MRLIRSRIVSSFLFAALLLLCFPLVGCMSHCRALSNHSLWHTRLPEKPDFSGVVFILQSPRCAEFAFLLAQRYPESYVVCTPVYNDSALYSMYLTDESMCSWKWRKAQTGHLLLRSGESPRTLPVTEVPLGQTLLFHQMHMSSCEALPELFRKEQLVVLSWPYSSPATSPNRSATTGEPPASTWDRIREAKDGAWFLANLPGLIVGVSFPVRDDSFGAHRGPSWAMDAKIGETEPFRIFTARNAEKEYLIGSFSSILLAPFVSDDPLNCRLTASEGGDFSPGGWANCLEQFFRNPRITSLASSVKPERAMALKSSFSDLLRNQDYRLEPIIHQKSRYLNRVERETIDSYSPNICLFKNENEPSDLLYYWRDSGKTNVLVTAAEDHDELLHENGSPVSRY